MFKYAYPEHIDRVALEPGDLEHSTSPSEHLFTPLFVRILCSNFLRAEVLVNIVHAHFVHMILGVAMAVVVIVLFVGWSLSLRFRGGKTPISVASMRWDPLLVPQAVVQNR